MNRILFDKVKPSVIIIHGEVEFTGVILVIRQPLHVKFHHVRCSCYLFNYLKLSFDLALMQIKLFG